MVKINPRKMQKKEKNEWECKDCGKCCQFGSGFLAENDKERIASFLKISEKELEEKYLQKTTMFHTEAWKPKHPHPFGPCIFYDEKKHCIIHEVKPLLCKLGNCQEDMTEEFYKKYFVTKKEQSQDEWNIREEVKNGRRKKERSR